MSDTIWVDVRGRSEDDIPQDNSIMLRMEKQLDRLAKKLNVAEPSDFYDYSELEAQFSDLDDDGDELNEPSASWFDPGPALTALRAIHNHLQQHPEDLGFKPNPSRAHWPGLLMEELEHCKTTLEGAASLGRQFRFLIVP